MRNALFAALPVLAVIAAVFMALGSLADNASVIAQAQAQIETARAAQEAAQAAQIASTGLTLLVVVLLVVVLIAGALIALYVMRSTPAQRSSSQAALVRNSEQGQLPPGDKMQRQIEMLVQLRMLEMLQQQQRLPGGRSEYDEVNQ